MKKLITGFAALALATSFSTAFAGEEVPGLKDACQAFIDANVPDSKTDCGCLAKKANEDEAAKTEFAQLLAGEITELGEAGIAVVEKCEKPE